MSKRIDVFIHIPKTAGLTVDDILKRVYRRKRIESIRYHHLIEDLRQLKEHLKKGTFQPDLIKGHYLNSIKQLSSRDFQFFTFFRDPYELFRSYYAYIRSTPHNEYHRYVVNMSLFEFIDFSQKICLDNLMTRHLSSSASLFDINLSPYEIDPFLVSKIDLEKDGLNYLEVAKETIDSVNFIPLMVDRFDESILLLQKELNWDKTPYYVKKNVSARKEDLTNMEKEKFLEINRYDYELFSAARGIFSKYLERSGINEAEIQEFRKRNNFFVKRNRFISSLKKPLLIGRKIVSKISHLSSL